MNVIVRSDDRIHQQNETLREYGYSPERASSYERDMADCIAMKTNEAYSEARKAGNR